ncbi:MAG: hypothetical protein ABJA78_13815 [Ferruginibacter sp.]
MKSLVILFAIIVTHTLNAQNVGIGTSTPAARLELTFNGFSNYGTALLINQDVVGNSDGPRIQFKKTMTISKSWTAGILNGVDVGSFVISEDGGINGFGTPRFTIAPGGNIGFGGTLAINGNTGTAGQVLTSNGAASPAWSNEPKYFFFSQTGNYINLNAVPAYIPGIHGQTFTTTFVSNLIITVTSNLFANAPEPAQAIAVDTQILDFASNTIGDTYNYAYALGGTSYSGGGTVTSTIYIPNVPAGTYSLFCRGFRISNTGNNNCSGTQAIIQARPL